MVARWCPAYFPPWLPLPWTGSLLGFVLSAQEVCTLIVLTQAAFISLGPGLLKFFSYAP
jgi:hypothetical protein